MIIEHIGKLFLLFEVVAGYAPFLFNAFPINIVRIDLGILGVSSRNIRGFINFLCVIAGLHCVWVKHLFICLGVFKKTCKSLPFGVEVCGGHFEKPEYGRILCLPDEVGHKRFERILSFAELNEVAQRCRFHIGHLG